MNTADRIADLSMIWKQASLVFPYFDRRAIDWEQAYYDYLPRVAEAKSEKEFHLLLAEFMNLLGDGHTDYLFPRSLQNENGYLPFTLRCLNDGYCVDSAVPALEKMFGARVMKLNGKPFCGYAYDLRPLWVPFGALSIALSAASASALFPAAYGQ